MKPFRTLFWLAGENSGDLHASFVMRRLNEDVPYLKHTGIGGFRMIQEGLSPLFPFSRFAVMGFIEVVQHLFFFMKVEAKIKSFFRRQKPDLVILVDYPGLNLRIARFAEDEGIPVLYYICPQFWAWKHNRVFQLKENTRHVACILPFEKELLNIHNINSTYVGHPIAEEVSFELDKITFSRFFGIQESKKWIGFFPGSRMTEVQNLLPVFLETAKKFSHDEYHILISKARSIQMSVFQEYLRRSKNITIVDGYHYEMMKYCDFLVLKSGTSTLEAAYIGTPAIIVYKANELSYRLGKRFIRINKIGLPNIVLEKDVYPELLQNDVNPDKIHSKIMQYLNDAALYTGVKKDLNKLHHLLGEKSASKETVKIIRKLLNL